ncbi:hypothetical protein [Streptomyces sp. NBC_01565]|uniref:hypothetical protein n=1 Tax=unclassified Streptomyces TaxID=2593676 RepID=UPI00224DC8CA|nr:hypothetical protein [Streptomyces sp. NBC_01565]MCX4539467.1 hypothetical protein [Streptomyces sp. NBC_01565]
MHTENPGLLAPVEATLLMFATDMDPETRKLVHVTYGGQGREKHRIISIGTDAAHTDALVTGDQPWASSPGLKGVTSPLMTLPVPGRETADGGSEHYLFWHDEGTKQLKYRTVRTVHSAPYTITPVTDDRAVSAHWTSMKNVVWPVTAMPVPGRQDVDGTNESYLFHYDIQGALWYSTISVSRDAAHGDALVVEARPVAAWWKESLKGIGQLMEIHPVPGRQNAGGVSEFYVFHQDGKAKKPMYRKIAVGTDAAHADTLVTEDRLVADWWPASLKGVE